MAEHARSRDGAGTLYQWVDTESVMILDAVTGEPHRFGPRNNSIGTFAEALDEVIHRMGWEGRLVIVKLQSVRGYQVTSGAKHE